MMRNKWVQSSLLMGVGFGIWLGGWVVMIHPIAFLVVPIPLGVAAAIIASHAQGTDGWGR